MDVQSNSLNWFEIPATDLERAKKFYETIFNIEMSVMEMGPMKVASFPYEMGSGKVAGGVATSPMHKPAPEGGVAIYLNGNPDLQLVLDRIETAGGKVTMPKTAISDEIGFMAFFEDSEGNNLGLHSGPGK